MDFEEQHGGWREERDWMGEQDQIVLLPLYTRGSVPKLL